MKKLLMTIITTLLLTLSGSFCYATGSEGAISQIELTDYVIIAGVIIFLIGMALILLALFLNPSRKNSVDEEYDEALDDINIIYEDDDIEEAPVEDIPEEEESADSIDEEDTQAEEPAEESFETTVEPTEEDADNTDEADEIEEAYEPEEAAEIEPAEEVEEAEEEVKEAPAKSIRLTLSGTNNPDLKIIDVTDIVTAGRRSTNDLLISDSAVSGEHCKFIYDGEALFIEDLNSTNGTFLNGEQIEKAEIKTGDTIILGQKQYRVTIS